MKPLMSILLAFALLAPCYGAEPQVPGGVTVPAFSASEKAVAQPITITGPSKVPVGVEATWRMLGAPDIDISKPLDQQLDWAIGENRLYVWVAAPGKPLAPLTVKLELVIGGPTGMAAEPVIRFTPPAAGEYRLLIDWNYGQDQLAEALFTAGPPVPPLPPDPPIPPDPPTPDPGAKFQVMLIHEANDLDNLPQGQVDVLSGRVFRAKLAAAGHTFLGSYHVGSLVTTRTRCIDGECETTTTPIPGMAVWFESVRGDPLPRICLAPLAGGEVRDFPLPADSAATIKFLEAPK